MFWKKPVRRPIQRTSNKLRLCVERLEDRLVPAADPAVMLADINTLIPGSDPGQLVRVGNKIFFAGTDGYHGRELFVTDGASPPAMVRDILPGFVGSEPTNLVNFGGLLYFSADDGVHGRELWSSDGSDSGTAMVANIAPDATDEFGNPVPISSFPTGLTAADDKLFFVADNGTTGRELFMSDGSAVQLTADIFPGNDEIGNPNWSDPRAITFIPAHNNESGNRVDPAIFFSADNGVVGRELWKADLNGQVRLIRNIFPGVVDPDADRPVQNSSNPAGMILFHGSVYFQAASVVRDDHGNVVRDEDGDMIPYGVELWRTNGTSFGTKLVSDINTGFEFDPLGLPVLDPLGKPVPHSSWPADFHVHNGVLYFSAETESTGRELWKTDGEPDTIAGPTTVIAHSLRSGPPSSNPTELTSMGGKLYFVANGGQGDELWKSDGTTAELVRDIRPGAGRSKPQFLTPLNGKLIFAASTTDLNRELWISDGTEDGTKLLKEIARANSASDPASLVKLNGVIYFRANDVIHGRALWRSDGTTEGTSIMDAATIATKGSNPTALASANGKLYFADDDGEHGRELWTSDGSTAGTHMVKDIFPGLGTAFPNSSEPFGFTAVGDKVFFGATSAQAGTELWVTDGTAAGTVLVKDIYPGHDSNPHNFVPLGNRLLFVAETALGNQLFISDGTPEGTIVRADIDGPTFGGPAELTFVGGRVFFRAGSVAGDELWVTDGSAAGTLLVADIALFGDGSPHDLMAVNGQLYFAADDGQHGTELWKSDGTPEGTMMVKDFGVEQGEAFLGLNPRPLAALGNTLFFYADNGQTGPELWKTDGTSANTVMVADIYPGEGGSFCEADTDDPLPNAAVFNGLLYFSALDDVHRCSLWVSDGTPQGTRIFDPDDDDSEPGNLRVIGDQLFFTAEANVILPGPGGDLVGSGRELWISDGSLAGTRMHTQINQVNLAGSDPLYFANDAGTVYFSANDAIHGREIWTTKRRLKADDPLFEILARDIAYRDTSDNRPALSPLGLIQVDDTISLAALGYDSPFVFKVSLVIHDPTGFDAYGLTGDNFDPILAVRGSAGISDFYSDLLPSGVGTNQYDAVKNQVFAWLNTHTTPGHPVSITGHSLGGALTQLIAAGYTAQGGRVDQVVSFNSPGISAAAADSFDPTKAERVMHYVTNGDPVSMAGDRFIAGAWRRSNFNDLNLLHNHTLPVLVDSISIDNPATPAFEVKQRPGDLVFVDYPDVTWLNDPFYYHTDPDYFVWMAAGELLVTSVPDLQQFADLPPALLFRSTVEQKRQEIGNGIQTMLARVDAIIAEIQASPDKRVRVPDVSFDLFGLLSVKAVDLSATYVEATSQLRLHGKVEVGQLYQAIADFSGDNYIGISPNGIVLVGQLAIPEIPLLPGFWELENLFVGIDTSVTPRVIKASGTLQIPTGIDLVAELEFSGRDFNAIRLRAQNVNKPIVPTGLFLQTIGGGVSHVAQGDPEPITLEGDLKITGGPQLNINLPSFAGGDFHGSLISLDVHGEINAEHLTANGLLKIIEGLATANGDVELNWTDGFLEAGGAFNVLGGLITANAAFRADASLNLHTTGNAIFSIPDAIPIIGGYQGLSGQFVFDFTNDNSFSNDFAAAWTTFNIPLIGPHRYGFRVTFDGSFGLIGAAEIDAILIASILVNVEAGTPWVLYSAAWDNDSPATNIVLTTPAGELLTEADIALRSDMAIVPELSSSKRRVVVVQNPAAGHWKVDVNDEAGLVNLRYHAFTEAVAPSVAIVDVQGGQQQSPVRIEFGAFDPDSNARVSLFYDTDNAGFVGVPIVSNLIENDGVQTYTWDPSQIPAGAYFIYAQIDDGANPPAFAYSATSINTAAPLAADVSAAVVNGQLVITGTDDVNHVRIEIGATGADPIRVVGLDGTMVNGQAFVEFTSVTAGVNVLLAGGDDLAEVTGQRAGITVVLDGGAGNDTLKGGTGPETLIGGPGADVIFDGHGDDIVDAGLDDDVVFATPGSDDVFIDVGGNDTLDFSLSNQGITLDLDTAAVQRVTDTGNTVQLVGQWENFIGSALPDHVFVHPGHFPRFLQGGSPDAGDRLFVDALGNTVSDDGAKLVIPGFADIFHAGFEEIPIIHGAPYLIDDSVPLFEGPGFFPSDPNESQGFNGGVLFSAANAGNTATWKFQNLPPGTYAVSATWTFAGDRAKNSPFTIRDGGPTGPVVKTLQVNQEQNPGEFIYQGILFRNLGIVRITGNQMTVQLSDLGADQFVCADAIRIEPIDPRSFIIDDGDPGFSTTAAATALANNEANRGAFGDTVTVGSGQTATYDYVGVPVGTPGYRRILATWTAKPTNPTNALYQIQNGAQQFNVTVNQQLPPVDIIEGGIAWKILAQIQLDPNDPPRVTLMGPGIADAVMILSASHVSVRDVSNTVPIEIVSLSLISEVPIIINTTSQAVNVWHVAVYNTGSAHLNLGTLNVTGTGYTLIQGLGATSLPPGSFTDFVVRFVSSVAGTFDAAVSLITDAFGQEQFNFGFRAIVIQDDTPPMVNIVAPPDGAMVIEGTTVPVTVEATDDVGVRRVEFLIDGQVMTTDTLAPFNFVVPVPAGVTQITLNARATDEAGNTGNAPPVVLNVVPDQPPTVQLVEPQDGAAVLAGSTIAVRAEATDDVQVVRVEFLVNGAVAVSDTSAPFLGQIVVPPAGNALQLVARAIDSAGHIVASLPHLVNVRSTARVTAFVKRGKLVLRGSAVADRLLVERIANKVYRITGLGGTMVNDQPGPVILGGISQRIDVRLGNGHNVIHFITSSERPVLPPILVDEGNGDLVLRITSKNKWILGKPVLSSLGGLRIRNVALAGSTVNIRLHNLNGILAAPVMIIAH